MAGAAGKRPGGVVDVLRMQLALLGPIQQPPGTAADLLGHGLEIRGHRHHVVDDFVDVLAVDGNQALGLVGDGGEIARDGNQVGVDLAELHEHLGDVLLGDLFEFGGHFGGVGQCLADLGLRVGGHRLDVGKCLKDPRLGVGGYLPDAADDFVQLRQHRELVFGIHLVPQAGKRGLERVDHLVDLGHGRALKFAIELRGYLGGDVSQFPGQRVHVGQRLVEVPRLDLDGVLLAVGRCDFLFGRLRLGLRGSGLHRFARCGCRLGWLRRPGVGDDKVGPAHESGGHLRPAVAVDLQVAGLELHDVVGFSHG